ncbi:MAG: hypothetical protein ACFFDN_18050 [Candidatus Hodarchaeota archaeon]
MNKEILPVKAKPETIPHTLEIIQKYEGDINQIINGIVEYLQQESQRQKKPSRRILYYAVTIPTLRKLKLIEGEGADIRLSPNGKRLFDAYYSAGISGFKKEFACHLLWIDSEDGNVISTLQKSSPLSIKELINKIQLSEQTTLDRLKKWLNYLKFVELVKLESDRVIIRNSQLEASLKKKNLQFQENEFIDVLLSEYKQIRNENVGMAYIPIPAIRDKVCEKFSDRGMWTWDFDKLLITLPRETDKYILQFTQPMERKEGGIYIGKRYYYFLHIHEKGAP